MFTMISFQKNGGTAMSVWISAPYHTASENCSRHKQPHQETGYSSLLTAAHTTATGTGFPSAPFKQCSVTTRGLKYLLWVWLQSARGPREVHSISWDPWCAWKAHPNSTFLASPLQVKQGPDLLFCLILLTHHVFLTTAGKGDQLWHMRSSDTKVFTAMFKHWIL